MATGLANAQALLPKDDRQASRGDLHKVLGWVTKALTPPKLNKSNKNGINSKQNNTAFLDAAVWQVATSAMAHASLLESTLVRKFGTAVIVGVTAALNHHADTDEQMDAALVHAMSSSLGRIVRSLRFVPKLPDAHALVVAASKTSETDISLVAVSLNCLLVGCSSSQPRKVFDALVCEETMQALVQWQQQTDDNCNDVAADETQAGLAAQLVRSLSKQVLSTTLFDRDILSNYSDACTRASTLLSTGKDNGEPAVETTEIAVTVKSNKRARKENKQGKKAKVHQHFLRQLFSVLETLSGHEKSTKSVAALESFSTVVSECHRCLVATAASAEVNPVSGGSIGIGKRKRTTNVQSVDTLLWLELLLVAQPTIITPSTTATATSDAAKVRAVVSLLHTGRQLGIYSAATHRTALSTWFATVFEQWDKNAQADNYVCHKTLDAQLLLVQQLVDIDHNIVEPCLTRVFVFAFTHRTGVENVDMEVVDTIVPPVSEIVPVSRFTLHIFAHYAKLRKLSLAITCLTSAAASGSKVAVNMCTELFATNKTNHDRVDQPVFETGVRESFRQLPSGQIAEAWDCFQASLVNAVTALSKEAEEEGNEWLMCMVTSLFVLFVDGVQVTQFNSALLKQRCQDVVDQIARPVMKQYVVDVESVTGPALVLLTSTSVLIVALTELARLCEAWTFDAMPTNVHAALGRKGDAVAHHNDNPLIPIDHPYVNDLMSPAFEVILNDPSALLPIDDFFKVVSELVVDVDDNDAAVLAATAAARESSTLLALTCMRSLHIVHFRPYALLGGQAPHATAGVEQTRKLIVFVLAQARAANVDGDLFLNRMLSGVNLEVVGQLAGHAQVDSLLHALVGHTCVALVSRGRAPGEPWTNSAFYEIPAFREGLSRVFRRALSETAETVLSKSKLINRFSPTFFDAVRDVIADDDDEADKQALHCISLLDAELGGGDGEATGSKHTRSTKKKKKSSMKKKNNNNNNDDLPMSLEASAAAIDLIAAFPPRFLPSSAAASLLTLALTLVLCGEDTHAECVRSALRLIVKLTQEFPVLVRSSISPDSLLQLLHTDKHSSALAKEQLVMAYCSSSAAPLTSADQINNETSTSNDAITTSVARALLQMANVSPLDATWLRLINALYRTFPASSTAAKSLSVLCDDILLVPVFEDIEPTDEMFGVLAGVLRCGVCNPKHPALWALKNGGGEEEDEDNSLFGRVVRSLDVFTDKAKVLLTQEEEEEEEEETNTSRLDNVVSWLGAMCSGVHVLDLQADRLDTLITLATTCIARGHSGASACLRDFVIHATITQSQRLHEIVLSTMPVGYVWSPCTLGDSFNAALLTTGEMLSHTPRSHHQQLATFVRALLPRLTSICRSASLIQRPEMESQVCVVSTSCRPWALLVAALSHKQAWGGKESARRRLRASVVGELLDACVGMASDLKRAVNVSVAQNTELAIADATAVVGSLVNNFDAASSSCAAAIVLAVLQLKDVAVKLSNDDVGLGGVPIGPVALGAVVRVFESLSNNKRVYRHHAVHLVAGLVGTFEYPGVHLSADRYVQDMANFTLDLCSPRELQQLHVGLSHAGQGTFRTLFTNFQQQHKFKGKT